jgi:hypothetical protein
MFVVRLGDENGPVIATFSNKLAAEKFAEKQQVKDRDTAGALPEKGRVLLTDNKRRAVWGGVRM